MGLGTQMTHAEGAAGLFEHGGEAGEALVSSSILSPPVRNLDGILS